MAESVQLASEQPTERSTEEFTSYSPWNILKEKLQPRHGRWTPLHWAANGGHTSSVACLLEMGALVDVAEKKEKWRPLHLACCGGHTPCAELLLSAGADINARDRNGLTPLHHCSREGHRPVLLTLLDLGAVVDCKDEKGMTPLFYACGSGHVSLVRDLVTHGADVNRRDLWGWTPLTGASDRGHEAVVKFLVEETKVDLEKEYNIVGMTALASAARKDHTQVMKVLLAAGAKVNARHSDHNTPLEWACSEGSLEGVRLLIEHGADWRVTNETGVNAVWYALRRGNRCLREYFMSLCGKKYMLEVSQMKRTLPERLKSEFTEIEEIGQGSFGTVVKGKKDGRTYAVKEVKYPDLPASTEKERNERPWNKEYEAMGVGLYSTFICRLIRHWRQGESSFFQMEFCELDLHGWMSKEKPKSRKKNVVLRFLCDCSSGLRYLHDQMKIIHRDIKPGNIFLRKESDVEGTTRLVAKIGDLGLVTDRSNPKGEFYFERSQGGGAGVYLAPEIKGIALKTEKDPVVHGVPKYDEKIDIYSIGAVYFDLLFLEPESGYSDCRWVVYNKFKSAFPDYFPVICRMLGGKEEKHERPPAYEVEDEAYRWLQEWLQTPESASEDHWESDDGEDKRKEEKNGNKMPAMKEQEVKRNKMAAAINEEQFQKMWKNYYRKIEEREMRKMAAMKQKELLEKEMSLKKSKLKTGLEISLVLLSAYLFYYFLALLGIQS
ncbi:unnamed protein product [Cyprideis torosa]|uniref:Uncharacterized protein n=1 Tax=Cyprideis torosa TaxID=163714 RepID=A0A7R8WKS7_9CRUS|nr:unnamed protein product [Cyprideis torosa]CAG0903539.1 unnamed protein product [Cyprideis torosa]